MDERQDKDTPQPGEPGDTTVRIGIMTAEELNQNLLSQLSEEQDRVSYLTGVKDALVYVLLVSLAAFLWWDLGRRIV